MNEEIDYMQNTNDLDNKKILAYKALGAVDIAVEFGLITYAEWEIYIKTIFKAA